MNRFVFILIMVAAVVVIAQTGQRITAPGVTGMNSDYDIQDLRMTDARFLLNMNVTDQKGTMMKRLGHERYGSGNRAISGASALYDEITKWSAAVGVGQFTDSLNVGGYWTVNADSSLTRVDSNVFLSDSTLGHFLHTGKNLATLNDSIPLWWTEYNGIHDFTACEVGLIHANQSSPPAIFTLLSPTANIIDSVLDSIYVDSYVVYDTFIDFCKWCPLDNRYDTTIDSIVVPYDTHAVYSINVATDTTLFDPRVRPLSPETPGVLRVFALNGVGGNLTGLYQYAVAFKHPNGVSPTNPTENFGLVGPSAEIGLLGNPSMVVKAKNGKVILTGFPIYPYPIKGVTADSTPIIIYRKRVDSKDSFRPLDSILYRFGDTVIYVDNIADRLVADTVTHRRGLFNVIPGGVGYITTDTGKLHVDSSWKRVSKYWYTYSYLDTILRLESPLGEIVKTLTFDTISFDTMRLGLLPVPHTNGWDAVRIYRTSQAGASAGDSLTLYAVKDIPLDNGYSGVIYVPIGTVADTTLIIDGGVLDEDGFTISVQADGGISALSSSFTDMEFWDDRLWGIGDPEFPSRLYRTDDFGFSSWDPLGGMFSIDEEDNDILIALERIPIGSKDGLLIFKRRKTYIAYGATPSDVEFLDGKLWGAYGADENFTISLLTGSLGALARNLVIRHGDMVYVVTNDLDVVRFFGTRIDTISMPVKTQILWTLTDTTTEAEPPPIWFERRTPSTYARFIVSGDQVILMNQINGFGIAWNTRSGTWSKVQYSFADIPAGSFKYDTISSVSAGNVSFDPFGDNNDLFFFDSIWTSFYAQATNSSNDTGETNSSYTTTYRSPGFGDGTYQWWMRSVQLTYAGVGPTITVRVIDNEEDTLATSSFAATDGNVTDVSLGFGRHTGKFLMLDITMSKDTGLVSIYDIRPDLVRVGKVRIE